MKQYSISLRKLFGIPITIHWTFWILIVWIVVNGVMKGQSSSQLLWYVLFVMAIFVCVGLHELGHALAAKRYGIKTHSITFLPIGGVARLMKIPDKPKQELIITIAGPMVNIIIALVLGIVLLLTKRIPFSAENLDLITSINASNFLFMLFLINIMLFIFNMIPAFPMDGGRIFRALLSFVFPRLKATRLAVRVGQGFAIVFVLLGLLYNPFLIVIAIFITLGAQTELQDVKFSKTLDQYKASDLMMRKFEIFNEDQSLYSAVTEILRGQDKVFIVKDDYGITGFFTKNDILKGLSEMGQKTMLKNIMRTNLNWVKENQNGVTIYDLMKKEQLPILLVGDQNQLSGIINFENIQEFIQLQASQKKFLKKEELLFQNEWGIEF